MSGDERLFVALEELPAGGLRAVEVGERRLLLCRAGGSYYALENRCPHAAVPLESGRLEGFTLECPLHGGRLDVRDGSPRAHPIRRPVATFPVRRVDGGVEIELA